MATLYYRPYSTELKNNDDDEDDSESAAGGLSFDRKSAITSRSVDLPEFQYIFHADDNDEDNISMDADHTNGDHYKLAVRRMGAEIINLRQYINKLSQPDPRTHHCPTCHMNDSSAHKPKVGDVMDLGSISKEELMKKYLILKNEYTEVSKNLQEYQHKIHKLQRDLIKRNESQAELIHISKAHSSQNVALHKLQSKNKKLEDTIREQEMIITKMEKQLEHSGKNRSRKLSPITEVNTNREVSEMSKLRKEKGKLQQELEAMKNSQLTTSTTTIPVYKPHHSSMSDQERLELYQLLDKAENRILTLEKQVSSKSHRDKSNQNQKTKDEFGLAKIQF